MIKKLITRITGDTETITSTIYDLSDNVYKTCLELKNAVEAFCKDEPLTEYVKKISLQEAKCDELVGRINASLYAGRFLPFSSEDWFNLVNLIDRQADLAERVVRLMNIKKIAVPLNLKDDILSLINEVVETVSTVNSSIEKLKSDLNLAKEIAHSISGSRDNVREIEYLAFNRLFSSKIDASDIILLKEIIYYITQIANVSQGLGERISAMAIKYSF